jgi:hypothetical protein
MANASPDRLFRSTLLRLGRLYNFDYAGDVHCQLNFKIPMAVLELPLDIDLSMRAGEPDNPGALPDARGR